MKSSDDGFEWRNEKADGLARVKMLMRETEKMAQKTNLHRNARKSMVAVGMSSAPGGALLERTRKERRSGNGDLYPSGGAGNKVLSRSGGVGKTLSHRKATAWWLLRRAGVDGDDVRCWLRTGTF